MFLLTLIWFNLFFSSCVDETKLCMGFPLCKNKNDLKLCKTATSWNLANADWKPILYYSMCPQTHAVTSFGQQIKVDQVEDAIEFNCLNRADENPFLNKKEMVNNETEVDTWLQLVNKPCSKDDVIFPFSSYFRRCLGVLPKQCVGANCKST